MEEAETEEEEDEEKDEEEEDDGILLVVTMVAPGQATREGVGTRQGTVCDTSVLLSQTGMKRRLK